MSVPTDPVFRMLYIRWRAGLMTSDEYDARIKGFTEIKEGVGPRRWALIGKMYSPPHVDVAAVLALLEEAPDGPPDPGDEMPD